MTTIHPHWDTEEGAVSVPVTARKAERAPVIPASSVSRRPAALAGIALVLTVGVLALVQRGDLALPAQTVATADIRITPTGFVPQAFAISAGQTITWINEDSIPHILASTNLPTDTSSPLESPPIFPGQRYTVTIPETTLESDYTYISRTSASLNGSVTISALSAAAQEERDRPPVETQPDEIPLEDTVDDVLPEPAQDDWQDDGFPTTGGAVRAGLPTNPYTVATAGYRPGGAASSAMSTGASRPTATVTAQTVPAAQYHRPTSQPSSGMGTWMLCLVAAYAIWILTRATAASTR